MKERGKLSTENLRRGIPGRTDGADQQEADYQAAGSSRSELSHGSRQQACQTGASEGCREKTKKLSKLLMKGYATMYGQCSDEVKEKLEVSSNWQHIQDEQLLHELIQKVKRICIRFNNHKQEVYNLVQSLKMLFLYTQNKKHTIEEYGRNFMSLWDTVKAFGESPGLHKGMIIALMQDPMKVVDLTKPTDKEIKKMHVEASESVKAALLKC
jgi:hypothetical protein